jgi:hypothetical protein
MTDLFVAVIARPGEQQRIPQLLRQRRDQRPQPLLQVRRQQVVFLRSTSGRQCLHRVPPVVSILRCRDQPLHPLRHALPPINRFPPGDGQQPGLERRIAAKALQLLERRHERFLGHVVCLGWRPDGRQGGPENGPAVSLDQLPECVSVAPLGPADQLQVRVKGELRDRHTSVRGMRRHGGWEK